jgi:hypothetical protein
MHRLRKALIVTLLSIAISGCATAPKKDLSKFKAADPHSILIVPPVNRSAEITAPDYLLSTISVPLAERGYYAFPVHLVKRVLEDDGLADADLVHNADPCRLCSLYGADAVLLISVERWDARYMILKTQVTVELSYKIKDGKTGDTLWEEQTRFVYTSRGGGPSIAGLVEAAIRAAVAKAAPNYVPLARSANAQTFGSPSRGLPPGPYRKDYKKEVTAN